MMRSYIIHTLHQILLRRTSKDGVGRGVGCIGEVRNMFRISTRRARMDDNAWKS
jgi:hypothetical protein